MVCMYVTASNNVKSQSVRSLICVWMLFEHRSIFMYIQQVSHGLKWIFKECSGLSSIDNICDVYFNLVFFMILLRKRCLHEANKNFVVNTFSLNSTEYNNFDQFF